MAMQKPARTAPVLNADAARAFIDGAAAADMPPGGQRRRRTKPRSEFARITLLVPPGMLAEIDTAVAKSSTARLHWIRQVIRAALDVAKLKAEAEQRVLASPTCAFLRSSTEIVAMTPPKTAS